jgi:hypothetical protein
MDRALLLELALRGQFVLIDRPLFTNRDHPERATRVTRTQTRKDLATVYDTANAGSRPGCTTRMRCGSFAVISRDPASGCGV